MPLKMKIPIPLNYFNQDLRKKYRRISHCERSEAIPLLQQKLLGLLRRSAPRNDKMRNSCLIIKITIFFNLTKKIKKKFIFWFKVRRK